MRKGCRLIAPYVTIVPPGVTAFASRNALSADRVESQRDRRATCRERDPRRRFIVIEEHKIRAIRLQLVDLRRPPHHADRPQSFRVCDLDHRASYRRVPRILQNEIALIQMDEIP
jgi:hypothetical protein